MKLETLANTALFDAADIVGAATTFTCQACTIDAPVLACWIGICPGARYGICGASQGFVPDAFFSEAARAVPASADTTLCYVGGPA